MNTHHPLLSNQHNSIFYGTGKKKLTLILFHFPPSLPLSHTHTHSLMAQNIKKSQHPMIQGIKKLPFMEQDHENKQSILHHFFPDIIYKIGNVKDILRSAPRLKPGPLCPDFNFYLCKT
jgi:hypothetical protein